MAIGRNGEIVTVGTRDISDPFKTVLSRDDLLMDRLMNGTNDSVLNAILESLPVPEIIVVADWGQRESAIWAEERATWEMYSHFGLTAVAGGYLTGNAAILGGAGLFVAGTVFDDAVQARADQLYYLDGLDGVWDGQSFLDNDFIPFW